MVAPASSTTGAISGHPAHSRLSTSEAIKLLCVWNPRKDPGGHARWAERLNDAAAACGLMAVLAEPGPPRLQDIITLYQNIDSNQAVGLHEEALEQYKRENTGRQIDASRKSVDT